MPPSVRPSIGETEPLKSKPSLRAEPAFSMALSLPISTETWIFDQSM